MRQRDRTLAEKNHSEKTVFLSDLTQPWDMAFDSSGRMFLLKSARAIGANDRWQNPTFIWHKGASLVADDFFCQGQTGMYGVALHPKFKSNQILYVYMPSNKSKPRTNRVVQLTLNEQLSKVLQRKDIVEDIRFKDARNRWGSPGAHSGGRLRFGPDGRLYITTGDNHNGPLPQSKTQLGGKVLRVDENGNGFEDNNSPGDPRIFTYGHRNIQGIDFQPGTNKVVVSEHGPGHNDEVTFLTAGGNGGWDPSPYKGVECSDNYCGYISNRPDGKLTSMTDTDRYPKAMPPVWNNEGDSQGTGPCVFLKGPHWKEWNGALAVGVMVDRRLEILQFNPDNTLKVLPRQISLERVCGHSCKALMVICTSPPIAEIWKVTANS
ncbi:MAG: PQQ-dependent sugar dehydrogenase [Bdellovibrionales bacterium]